MSSSSWAKYVKCEIDIVPGDPYKFLMHGKWTDEIIAPNLQIDRRRRKGEKGLFERYKFKTDLAVCRVKGSNQSFMAPGQVFDVKRGLYFKKFVRTSPWTTKPESPPPKKKRKRTKNKKKTKNQSNQSLALTSTDEDDNDTNTNPKNTLSNTHSPHNKQTLLKSRNRFDLNQNNQTKRDYVPQFRSEPPPTVKFYSYVDKKQFIDQWQLKFDAILKNTALKSKNRSSIQSALSDINDAPKYGITIDRYHAIAELYMHMFHTNASMHISKNDNHQTHPFQKMKQTKKESQNMSDTHKKCDSTKAANIDRKDYCHICNRNFAERRSANNNVIYSVSIHWRQMRDKDKDKHHLNADKYMCNICNVPFANEIVLQTHMTARHSKVSRKGDGKTDILCGHDCQHTLECRPRSCRQSKKDINSECDCTVTICKSLMYASWNTQKGKYVAMCEDKRCRNNRVPSKCVGNPKDSKVCQVCEQNDPKCEWSKINYSVKSAEDLVTEFESNKTESECKGNDETMTSNSNNNILGNSANMSDNTTNGDIDLYHKIKNVLKQNCGNSWKEYLQNFVEEEVMDSDVMYVEYEQLNLLIPKLGPRNRFWSAIESEKQSLLSELD